MIRNAAYVTNKLIDIEKLAKPAQVGVDLTVNRIHRITKTITATVSAGEGSKLAESTLLTWLPSGCLILEPGAYLIDFDQGLRQLAENEAAFIVQRSTLNRSGCQLVGSVFDPGFHTQELGATLYAWAPICIYKHARLAQLLIHECEPSTLYQGQYQGKANS